MSKKQIMSQKAGDSDICDCSYKVMFSRHSCGKVNNADGVPNHMETLASMGM